MQHPNIVGVYDRSEWDGTPYIAMELVDGQTLKELVTERGPLPPERRGQPDRAGPAARSATRTSAGSSIATSSPRT